MAEKQPRGSGLLELCEPLFAYVCTLNRGGRSGAILTPERVRGELEALFDRLRSEAAGKHGLSTQFKSIEEPLHGFVDSMIQRSSLPFARAWKPMAWDLKDADRAFEDTFYVHMERALQERGPEADERIAVFYTCLCLGFRGDPAKRTPEFLTAQMDRMQPALKRYQQTRWEGDSSKLCGEAYDHTDSRKLWQPLGVSLATVMIVLVFGVVLILVATSVIFKTTKAELEGYIDGIADRWTPGGGS